ncbi:AAA family ATPase [Spirosoma sp. KNUC1025]|uniref:ATP-binding sensor histidine kinase n=1 Tax=Spirosoma sp. KNUC1025 TaxID=2894082 RepID=UPI003867C4B5
MDKLNYKINGQLHVGPKYIIYRATQDDAPVVLKMLKTAYPTAQALNRLRNEFAILQQVRQENVIQALGIKPFENSLAIVCEEVPGNKLSEYIGGKPVDLPLFFAIALPLVRAVQDLHQRRIIHKNISPANVIFDATTRKLTLCGFSLATELARELQQYPDAQEVFEADLSYISPEQTGRMNRALDHRTDLYSLGSLFYELLVGQPPFVASEPLELVYSHIARQPRPPAELRPDLPAILSQIVLKLLAKNPENRYQSASGLLYDLQRCSEALTNASLAEVFSIGAKDIPDQFQIPGKLYGRTDELEQLLNSFRLTESGSAELVLVSGYSGVGKSGLVRELQKVVVQNNGFFISGKFDQFKRNVPLSSLLAAFRELIRQLLTGTNEQIDQWRQKALDAVGATGQVIIDVIPEVALLIGPQPAIPELPLVEANNRFNELFDRFVSLFVQDEYPICIFLDDLQWIDSATLQWLETRLTNQALNHFLFIGAYRDNEVTPSHPLMLMMDRLNQRGVAITNIHLQPLDKPTLGQMVADSLSTTPEQCADLTDVLFQKTDGNPFFARQCLLTLYENGAIYFVPEQQRWAYTLDQVYQVAISDNVVDFMAGLIRKLPAGVQNLLKLAACIGNQFDLTTLGLVSEQDIEITTAQLAIALQQGLVIPVQDWNKDGRQVFGFLHDRVQQAAFSLLQEPEKQTTRLQIGRLLLHDSPAVENDDRLYDIADHLNFASHLIDDADETQKLIEINLAAGVRAKNSSAYEPALRYIKHAMDLIPAQSWEKPSVLMQELLLQRAECEHLCGNNQVAETYFDQAILYASATLDKARIYQRKIHYFTNLGKFEEAYQTGREAVKRLGVSLPASFSPPAFIKELITYRFLIGNRKIEDIIQLKVMTDERLKMAVLLMATFSRAAYQIKPELCVAVCARMMNICLRHGNTDGGSIGYMAFGSIFLGALLNRKQAGFDFGQLTLALVDKFNSLAYKAETYFVVGYFAVPWRRPALEMERYWQIAYEAGLETGDFFHASCACCGTIQSYYMRGMAFDKILEASDRYLEFLNRIKNREAILTLQAVRQSIRNLRGQTESPDSYSDDTFNEETYVAELSRFGSRHFAHYYYINKMQTLFLWGKFEQAYKLSVQSDQYLKDSPGMLHTAEHYFYKGLIICALYPKAKRWQQIRWKATLQKIRKTFRKYAEGAPSNFIHKSQLLSAEICRISNELDRAEGLYYEAVDSARRYEYDTIVALASELLVRFHEQARRRRVAGFHLSDADYAFRKLGANAYADKLLQRYPTLFDHTDELELSVRESTKNVGHSLDLTTVLKSSEAISREIRLPDLLSILMKVIIENAGGERMIFLLQRSGELVVQADYSADTGQVQILPEIPLNDYTDVAKSIVHFVARTYESIILDDAAVSGNFTNDVYIKERKSRSLLCIPLVQQRKLIGVIYLENNLTSAAFTPDRIDLLSLLSGQMAISVENALLYKNLEEKVTERTAELNQSLEHLRTTQDQLIHSEKMASLGELTAGIAHEIQNPLNFVNNFSEISAELVSELAAEQQKVDRNLNLENELLTDIRQNLQKINQHGKRAENIVKGMLEHSRTSVGQKASTNLNALVNEYLKLAYHGLRAKDNEFNAELITNFDTSLVPIEAIPQDLGRVLLNLFNNSFYALREKKKALKDYQPTITVSTYRNKGLVELRVKDNGTGMPESVKQKIFQPFFTTKPTGQGTGLGLSLSYDIITKGHGGQIQVQTENGQYTEMIISLPAPVEGASAISLSKQS